MQPTLPQAAVADLVAEPGCSIFILLVKYSALPMDDSLVVLWLTGLRKRINRDPEQILFHFSSFAAKHQ